MKFHTSIFAIVFFSVTLLTDVADCMANIQVEEATNAEVTPSMITEPCENDTTTEVSYNTEGEVPISEVAPTEAPVESETSEPPSSEEPQASNESSSSGENKSNEESKGNKKGKGHEGKGQGNNGRKD